MTRTSPSWLRFAALAVLAAIVSACIAPAPLPSTQQSLAIASGPVPSASGPAPSVPSSDVAIRPTSHFDVSAIAAIDGETMLLGGVESTGRDEDATGVGAVWRTDDRGRTWALISEPASPVRALAAAEGAVWAAVGCADATCPAGILRSDDRGRTWTEIDDRAVASISVIDRRHVWALLAELDPDKTVLLRTDDGGATWHARKAPCWDAFGTARVASFVGVDRGWVGCADQPGAGQEPKSIWITNDGGSHWQARSMVSPDRHLGTLPMVDYLGQLLMRPNGRGLLTMGRGTTLRTDDAGKTWTAIPPGSFDVVIAAAAALLDDDRWLIVVSDGDLSRQVLLASEDAGETWTALPPIPR